MSTTDPFAVPLYMTPPSTASIREHIRAEQLGAIVTPAQGNKLEEGWWWCADNGVFGDAYPGDDEFLAWLRTLRPFADRCLFAVAPDVVADFEATWRRSYDMLQRIRDLGFPAALVAQDRMEISDAWDWPDFDALFVGGSTAWKLSPAAANLARCARSIGHIVHLARVSSLRRYRHAHDVCHADSVDGTYLTNAPDKLLPDVLGWRRAMLNSEPAFNVVDYNHDPWDGAYDAREHRDAPTRPQAAPAPPAAQAALFDIAAAA